MGCSMSSSMEPEDTALPHSRHKVVRPINSSASIKSRVSTSVEQGDAELMAEKGIKNAEDKDNVYVSEILFLPGSPSFKDYCISHSRDASSETTDSTFSTRNAGDEDSAKGDHHHNNNPGDNKGIKKKERIRGFKNAMHKGMARRKRNFFNFGCYTSHPSCDAIDMNHKPAGKIA